MTRSRRHQPRTYRPTPVAQQQTLIEREGDYLARYGYNLPTFPNADAKLEYLEYMPMLKVGVSVVQSVQQEEVRMANGLDGE